MNTQTTINGAVPAADWRADLEASRDLTAGEKRGYAFSLFKEVCMMEEVDLGVRLRKTPPKEGVFLHREELLALLDKLEGVYQLAAKLHIGAGLRRHELVTLRIKDVDLTNRTVTVRRSKANKDRVTVIPEVLVEPLRLWKAEIRKVYDADREAESPGVAMPGALGRRMPKAGERWPWFWLFPAAAESADPDSGIRRRHHIHADVYGRAISKAAQEAGIEKWVTSHALRHTFTTMLLSGGVDIRTAQELLGHADLKTTAGYIHAATGIGKAGVKSPLDAVFVGATDGARSQSDDPK